MIKSWWFSSNAMTVNVDEIDGIIVNTAPITHKFIGQPLENLKRWMTKQGGFRMESL